MKAIFTCTFLAATFFSFAGELFLKVNRSGTYYSSISGQTQYNNTNIFRFFDLSAGNNTLSVFSQGTNSSIFSSTLAINSNDRIIAELDNYGNLTIIQTIRIAVVDWYTSTPIQVVNGSTISTIPSTINTNNDQAFGQFLILLEDSNFDSKRVELCTSYLQKTTVSSQQIKEMIQTMSFDSSKEEIAILAYSKCFDQQNYFLLQPAFNFKSSYDNVLEEVK